MAFHLVIDTRENVFKEYFDTDCFQTLDVADIIIKRDEEIVVAIERKTIDDLKASILDGRWKEQKARLCCSIPRDRIIYLIEGNILKKTTIKGGSTTLIGATINCMLRDNIKVYKTGNVKESVSFIQKIFDSIQKNYEQFFLTNENSITSDYTDVIKIKKKDNHNPGVWYKQILLNIPQLSSRVADCIISKYPTLRELLHNFDENELKNLTYTSNNGKARKIGPKLAQKICLYLEH